MPRLIVLEGQHVFMDEDVRPVHLNDEHTAVQLLERLAWAIEDADRRLAKAKAARRVKAAPSRYREVSGA